MEIVTTDFGKHDGKDIFRYTLKNNRGTTVKLTNYGATITSILLPNKNGGVDEIVCGFDTLESYFSKVYLDNAPYFGGTVGRYASRIKDAKFTMDGVDYPLANNGGGTTLHGGAVGFDKKVWRKVDQFTTEDTAGVTLSLFSPHMEEGFPGNLHVEVKITLNNTNEIRLDYTAKSDQDTPVSLTNHTYFNLSGFASSIEDHTVTINASKRQVWDESGAATGENVLVEGNPFDLRTPQPIKNIHESINDGFDHYYIFEEKGFEFGKVAEIACEESGRSLEVSTSEPGMLFYTGKYTSNNLQRESGDQYGKYRALCCETHRYPNGPNLPDSPQSILRANDTFNSTTIFKFIDK